MTSPWLKTTAASAVAACALLFGAAAPVWANSTVAINGGNVPTTAAGFVNHECSANQGGGPFAGSDVWVFVLPGTHAQSGDFVSVTAQFSIDGNDTADVTKVIAADGGGFLNGGPATAKAFIALPAGWKLITATAEITGTAEFFNLTHTCVGTATTPTPPVTTPPVTTPPATTPPATTTPPPTDPGTTPTDPGTPGGDPRLPTTGPMLTGLIAAGVALIIAGSTLVFLRRRHDTAAPDKSALPDGGLWI